jgi:hypothetical protein
VEVGGRIDSFTANVRSILRDAFAAAGITGLGEAGGPRCERLATLEKQVAALKQEQERIGDDVYAAHLEERIVKLEISADPVRALGAALDAAGVTLRYKADGE